MLVKPPANYSYYEYDQLEKLEDLKKEMVALETKPDDQFTDDDSDRLNVVYDAVNELSQIIYGTWRR